MQSVAAAGASLALAGRLRAEQPETKKWKKAIICQPEPKNFHAWKTQGFDGVESNFWWATPQEAAEGRKEAEKAGMRIHSVLFGWARFNMGEKAMAEGIEQVQHALQTAKFVGADTVLLVPCRIDGFHMPKPAELDMAFDPATGMIERVVAGDNNPYKQYIDAHNHATKKSREAVEKLIPAAKAAGVVLALENVWNNLWPTPALFANFVASFDSPWVKAYFDIGNHVKYAPPQKWIETLGKLIVKCHVKDFKLDANSPQGGDFCELRKGSVDWPVVTKALRQVGYNGWLTIEGSGTSEELDLIIEGK